MRLLPLLLLLLSMAACSSPEAFPDYTADLTLTSDEQAILLSDISRHIGRLPRHGTHETKFEVRFDDHYATVAAEHRIDLAHFDETSGTLSILASRIAPSVTVKRVGIAVRMRRSDDGSLTEYEEVFRTWRMTEPELAEKGTYLFHKMVTGQDLTPYTPEHSADEYIEFPNANVRYDVEQRQWITAS
jgi:hypothetical protein